MWILLAPALQSLKNGQTGFGTKNKILLKRWREELMITPVSKVMTRKLLAVPMGTTLFEAHQLMTEKRIRHLPVIDDKEEVVGIISQRDLAAIPNSKNVPVELLMTSSVAFVEETVPLRQAIFKVLQMKISSLLVISKDTDVVGIVTTDDLLWYLAHLLADEKDSATISSFEGKQLIGELANTLSNAGI